jgi:hypothetical protein
MPREGTLGWTGGYVGLSLLAALVTLGVMLILFTDARGATTMQIEVGDVLTQACNGGDAGYDSCYAVVVRNVSDGPVSGSVTCTVTDPAGGRAKFVNDQRTYHSEPIPPGGSATVLLQVRPIDGPTDPPTVSCAPTVGVSASPAA